MDSVFYRDSTQSKNSKKKNWFKAKIFSEFYDLAKDLPTTIELADQSEDSSNNNVEVIGTHLLLPHNSMSQVVISTK